MNRAGPGRSRVAADMGMSRACASTWVTTVHRITHIHRVVTDDGACYRSGDVARIVGHRTRHRTTKPFPPRHDGKVERYQRIMAEELRSALASPAPGGHAAAPDEWSWA